jgi:hypothetical protein
LPESLSDALCRLSTGGGIGKRKLFTDDDESLLEVMRPAIITSIENLATRDDLRDRAIAVELPVIPKGKRGESRGFQAIFEKVRPRVLGALLDAVSAAMRDRDSIELEELPRMADAAKWIVAAEPALGFEGNVKFLDAYQEARDESLDTILESNAAVMILRDLARQDRGWYVGELHVRIVEIQLQNLESMGKRSKIPEGFPETPKALSGLLNRYAPALREAGVVLEWQKKDSKGRRIKLGMRPVENSIEVPSDNVGFQPSQPSQPSQHRPVQGLFDDHSYDHRHDDHSQIVMAMTNDEHDLQPSQQRSSQEYCATQYSDGCDGCDDQKHHLSNGVSFISPNSQGEDLDDSAA